MPAAATWQVDNLLAVAGAQLCFVPVVPPNRVDLRDVKFALVERDAMRRVQTAEHGDHPLRASGVLSIRESQHRAIAHIGDQQHAARTEGHLAGVRRFGENGNMETRGQGQPG